jgi:hypothetical protein
VAGPCPFLLLEVALCWAVGFASSSHPSRLERRDARRGPRPTAWYGRLTRLTHPAPLLLGAPLRMYVRFAPSSPHYPAIPATSMQIGGAAGGRLLWKQLLYEEASKWCALECGHEE